MKIKKYLLLFLASLFLTANAFAVTVVTNSLGTQEDNLHLELGKNAASWGTYPIAYQGNGNMPNQGTEDVYSVWNVKDAQGHYYGTFTLHSNGTTAWPDATNFYKGGDGYYLEGVDFKLIQGTSNNYQLTTKAIHKGVSAADTASPF